MLLCPMITRVSVYCSTIMDQARLDTIYVLQQANMAWTGEQKLTKVNTRLQCQNPCKYPIQSIWHKILQWNRIFSWFWKYVGWISLSRPNWLVATHIRFHGRLSKYCTLNKKLVEVGQGIGNWTLDYLWTIFPSDQV